MLSEEQKGRAREAAFSSLETSLSAAGVLNTTCVTTYEELELLTQVRGIREKLQSLSAASDTGLDAAEECLEILCQLKRTDEMLQSIVGYLTRIREVATVARRNMEGVTYRVLVQSGRTTHHTHYEGRRYEVYMDPVRPDGVVYRERKERKRT